MGRYRSACMVVVVCALVVGPGSLVRAKYGGGQGTAEEPYLIGTAEHLCALGAERNDWRMHFRLTADIDLSEPGDLAFSPIGVGEGSMSPWTFRGVFDGAGHTVRHLTYSTSETGPQGFFGHLGHRAEVRDLILADLTIDAPEARMVGALIGDMGYAEVTGCSVRDATVVGKDRVGGLVGQNWGTLVRCSFTGEVAGGYLVGGLVGNAEEGAINGCRSEAMVTGVRAVGGLVGRNNRGRIESCHSVGTVSGSSTVGGLVGRNSGTIRSCGTSGTVDGNEYVGGFTGVAGGTVTHGYATGAVVGETAVGGFAGSNSGQIMFCYAAGSVSGEETVAGFAPNGVTFLCYWDIESSGVTQSGMGRGRTTDQMRTAATFVGWGYEGQWCLSEGDDYPRLIWERSGGTLLVDAPRVYAGGTGEPDDPYLIETAEQLVDIARYVEDLDRSFRLVSDIDLACVKAEDVMPIGASGTVFSGSFAGGEHAIRHFTCRSAEQDRVGFFGTIGPNGSVRDLLLMNATVSGHHRAGMLVGHNGGTVENCFVTGWAGGVSYVGGLVGYNEGRIEASAAHAQVTGQSSVGGMTGCNAGQMETCGVFGRVTGESSVGGLVGRNDKEVFACRAAATVSGDQDVGGLVGAGGRAQGWTICPAPPPSFVPGMSDSRIAACYALGSVRGRAGVGGLVGQNAGAIMGCYAACPVRSLPASATTGLVTEMSVGGLVGLNDDGATHSSYWDLERSGVAFSAGGQGRTTAEMVRGSNFGGWGDRVLWVIDEANDYPRLVWEETGGAPIVGDPFRYGGGTGQADDPYQIWTAEEFVNIGRYPGDWNRHYVLMADLDLANIDPNTMWSIGVLWAPFCGVFDGQGFALANFTCPRDAELYAGLFGSIGRDLAEPYGPAGVVANLNLERVDVAGFCKVGALAGYNAGTISACSVTGRVVAHGKNAGGLIGYNTGTLTACAVDCNVTSEEVVGTLAGYSRGLVTGCSGAGMVMTVGPRDSYAGGLIGENDDAVRDSHFAGQVVGNYAVGGLVALNQGTVQRCSAQATISGTYLLGGLVGYNENSEVVAECFADSVIAGGNSVGGLVGCNNGEIRDCFARGQLKGGARVGGLVGQCGRTVTRCYSLCSVEGYSLVGGLVGQKAGEGITSCFWDVEVSGVLDGVASTEPDPAGAIGSLTPALKRQDTFTSAGWDFIGESENGTEDIWLIEEGLDYPRLVNATAN